ncbi:hypothetical protein ACIRU8_39390 [Streptomyces sp. NPDC101175]|uniref:hypothetical protein n=1 Tax=Streptomyces sp. NPDC101175 TaxID=3366123 RepID=UPI00383497CB
MTDRERLFETAVRDGVVVLKLLQEDICSGPAFTKADESTEKAKAVGWTFKEIEAEAERRVSV